MTRRADLTITIPPRAGVSITLPLISGVTPPPYEIIIAGSTKATAQWRARAQSREVDMWGEPIWTTQFFPLDDLEAAMSWVGSQIIGRSA